ncbi:DNA polymerase III subunit chi [Altererythrobacter lutimaris]|uniref:DNA polymerase III subunit chi n=1 Tax=Altererythrobacter lutimaris TaxID=2743979 RepID=A0A850H9M6_9SPHN|nr:DNA polymerase III subunit chi [Altererythrobacter lutimaris]NVE93576.1 DNA polymerase III subunit chi [Altererythrobacter lutimaris]
MRVDFYQLSRDPVERVTVMLARLVLKSGNRLLIVSDNPGQRAVISRELWSAGPEEFLANGEAENAGASQQPILLSGEMQAANSARMVLFADGKWREEATDFDRAFLLFGPDETQAARDLWRGLDGQEGAERFIHKQDENGRWQAGS